MASQIANAGAIIFSKAQEAAPEQIQESIKRLNAMLEEFHSNRTLTDEVITKPWNELTPEDYEKLLNCGWHSYTFTGWDDMELTWQLVNRFRLVKQ